MGNAYVLYNPLSGGGRDEVLLLEVVMDGPLIFQDITAICDCREFLSRLAPEDQIIIAGGDGTLNRFINNIAGLDIENEVLYFPTGTGNDFARELGHSRLCQPFSINKYLKNLPTVEINGRRSHFLNGIGFGVDGYCCEVGDQLRSQGKKKVNYTAIAIKGLLLHFKPRNAVITVDGVRHEFRKVWIAPTMHGKCYGGGMMPAPNQDRLNGEGKLSVMVFYGGGRLRTLMAFPSIFKGGHIRHTSMVKILEGRQIRVEFDAPTALQIDGETVLGVTVYEATGANVGCAVS